MKKLICALLCTMMMLVSVCAFAEVYVEEEMFEVPDIKSHSAILMDMKTGRVIYSKNPDDKLYPASTTKILTGVLALEYSKPNEVITADLETVSAIKRDESGMGILVGERLSMFQLINGMMVYSANDAANLIAKHISKTEGDFMELMNKKAKELGATNTNFTNPCGIQDENHYTTAHDLAKISRYAMSNEKFREIVGKQRYSMPPTNKYTKKRDISNTNLLISAGRNTKYYYGGTTGIKTGHTEDAGYCLVSSVEKDGAEVLCVVMKSENREVCYDDTKTLLNYAFGNYMHQTIASGGETVSEREVYEAKGGKHAILTVTKDISAFLPYGVDMSEALEKVEELPEVVKAPIKKDEVVGKITYKYKGNVVGEADLVATNDVERSIFLFIYHIITAIIFNPFVMVPAITIALVFIQRKRNIKRQEERRRQRELRASEFSKQMNEDGENTESSGIQEGKEDGIVF